METNATRYHEVQRFSLRLLAALAVGVAILFVLQHRNDQTPDTLQNGAAVLGLLLVALVPAFTMTTDVSGGMLTIAMPIVLNRAIRLEEIAAARPVSVNPLLEFRGWGIRLGRGGTYYGLRGRKAVEVTTKEGKVIFIGSAEPDRLASAIKA
jgi:hypothetical protein